MALSGINSINQNLSQNRTTASAKAGGSSTAFNAISVPQPTVFATVPGISDSLIALGTAGSIGLCIGYAKSPNTINAANEISKLVDVRIANNNIANQDGIHSKVYDVQPLSSGFQYARNGSWLVNGVATGTLPTGVARYERVSGSGDREALARIPVEYHYKQGTAVVDKKLPVNTLG